MRIMIFGRPGSGKSTSALRLAQKLYLPLYHLDKYFFVANWIERDYQEFLQIQQDIVFKPNWIIDGNSLLSLELRYAKADICIYFKYPRLLCLWRLIKRMFIKNATIDDRAVGCRERVSWHLIKYMWTFEYRKNNRLMYQLESLAITYPDVELYVVRNDQELECLINTLIKNE